MRAPVTGNKTTSRVSYHRYTIYGYWPIKIPPVAVSYFRFVAAPVFVRRFVRSFFRVSPSVPNIRNSIFCAFARASHSRYKHGLCRVPTLCICIEIRVPYAVHNRLYCACTLPSNAKTTRVAVGV